MRATITDLRRGDKFTWAGTTYYAVDDARPMNMNTASSGVPQAYDVSLAKAAGLTPNTDGVIDVDTKYDRQAIAATTQIDIISRDHPIHRFSDDAREETPAEQALGVLHGILDARRRAQRDLDDLDESRDIAIRQALVSGVSAIDLAEETGLSRGRIYQIRDGRR